MPELEPSADLGSKGRPFVGEQIVVIGNTSSGKSTLAAQLAELVGGTHIELDALFWLPGWQESENDDFRAKVSEAIEGEARWASSGNYLGRGAQPILWPAADTLIWLDMPLRTVLRRVITRSWQRSRSDELLWGTNTESFTKHLKLWDPEESLIAFAIKYHRIKQREYQAQLADPRWAHLQKYRLRTPRAVASFLEAARASRTVGVARG